MNTRSIAARFTQERWSEPPATTSMKGSTGLKVGFGALICMAMVSSGCGGSSSKTCSSGASCQSANSCHTATIVCTGGSPVCTDDGNEPDGTTCGTGMSCAAGVCTSGNGVCGTSTACTVTVTADGDSDD